MNTQAKVNVTASHRVVFRIIPFTSSKQCSQTQLLKEDIKGKLWKEDIKENIDIKGLKFSSLEKNKNTNRSQTRSITSGNWLAPCFPAQNALGTDLNRTLLRNDPGDLGEKQTTGASSGVTSKLGISARGYLSDTDTQIIHKATMIAGHK